MTATPSKGTPGPSPSIIAISSSRIVSPSKISASGGSSFGECSKPVAEVGSLGTTPVFHLLSGIVVPLVPIVVDKLDLPARLHSSAFAMRARIALCWTSLNIFTIRFDPRCGRFPPEVRTAIPVDGRFEHIVLLCNATSDHAIIWIERESENAKFQAIYEKFSKEKATHLQTLKDALNKYEEEKEKLFTLTSGNTKINGRIDAEKLVVIELPLSAMDEILKMAQLKEPLWVSSMDPNTVVLDKLNKSM
nr:sn1-specific diacylglycerol lipase alpha-like [Ipomoea batatas]